MGKGVFIGFIHRPFPRHFCGHKTVRVQAKNKVFRKIRPGHANVYRLSARGMIKNPCKISHFLLLLRQNVRRDYYDFLVHHTTEIVCELFSQMWID